MIVDAALHTILAIRQRHKRKRERTNKQTNECIELLLEHWSKRERERKPHNSHCRTWMMLVSLRQNKHHANLCFAKLVGSWKGKRKKKGKVWLVTGYYFIMQYTLSCAHTDFRFCSSNQQLYLGRWRKHALSDHVDLPVWVKPYGVVPFQLSGHCVCGSICIAHSRGDSQPAEEALLIEGSKWRRKERKSVRACNAWSNIEDCGEPLGQLTLLLPEPLRKATEAHLMTVCLSACLVTLLFVSVCEAVHWHSTLSDYGHLPKGFPFHNGGRR